MNKISNKKQENRLFYWWSIYWPIVLIILYFSIFYFQSINFITADLGRHIINGKEILNGNFDVLNKNYYSYSETSFPFINHHWLFGVIAYSIKKLFGFYGLTLLNWILNIGAIIFSLLLAKKKSNIKFAALAGFIAIPLITSRTEIRPESISLFIFSAYIYVFDLILNNFKNNVFANKKINNKVGSEINDEINNFLLFTPFLLLVTQIIWTNSHLFFIFGPFIAGLFLIKTILKNIFTKDKKVVKLCVKNRKYIFIEKIESIFVKKIRNIFTLKVFYLTLVTFGLIVATIINPHGIRGSLSPFHIFDNYGYRVAENQSTWFMIGIKNQTVKYSYYIFSLILGLISFIHLIKTKEYHSKNVSQHFLPLTLFLIFGIMTQIINRLSSFFGIIFIPILAENLFIIYKNNLVKIKKILNNTFILMILSPLTIGIMIFLISANLFLPTVNNLGLGLNPKTNSAVNFFKNEKLSGPIFNNYDIGGYLIYYLFPKEKVFVDSRPESYSENFFKNKYIKPQENERSWENLLNEYKFETIFYYRLDQTDWAQKFLYRRIMDRNWIPVYVDQQILILVKNDQKNKKIIQKNQLLKNIFSFSKTNL